MKSSGYFTSKSAVSPGLFPRRFSENSGNVPSDWTIFLPRHLLEDLDPGAFYDWDFWTHPVGNGPYRYVRHVPKTMIAFEANPDYFLGQPKIERVVLKFGDGQWLTYFN